MNSRSSQSSHPTENRFGRISLDLRYWSLHPVERFEIAIGFMLTVTVSVIAAYLAWLLLFGPLGRGPGVPVFAVITLALILLAWYFSPVVRARFAIRAGVLFLRGSQPAWSSWLSSGGLHCSMVHAWALDEERMVLAIERNAPADLLYRPLRKSERNAVWLFFPLRGLAIEKRMNLVAVLSALAGRVSWPERAWADARATRGAGHL